jgi:gamma-tubulin complex component 2
MSEIDKGALDVTGGNGITVKGGEVLIIIYECMQNMSGDPTVHMLHNAMLRAAATPYVAMLKVWMTTGCLVDPYEGLCAREQVY